MSIIPQHTINTSRIQIIGSAESTKVRYNTGTVFGCVRGIYVRAAAAAPLLRSLVHAIN